jgi:N-acylglucosamine 2-epimerase
MKYWWPHNEAIIATLLAYKLTGESHQAERFKQVYSWAHEHFADPKHGEWFGYLNRDGTRASDLKGNHWKGPFHLPRMQWYVSRI